MTPPQAWKMPTSCDHCGSTFTRGMPWQRFCSTNCKKNYAYHHSQAADASPRECIECGATFIPWNPRCKLCGDPCRRARRSRLRAEWQSTLPRGYRNSDLQEAAKRQHDRSLDRARNHGNNWTGPELELVARGDLTTEELTIALGRTSYAIHSARRLLRVDPRKQALAGSPNPPREMEQS